MRGTKNLNTLLSALLFSILFFSCETTKSVATNSVATGNPSWIMNGNIYEVNIRQYTPEGTFNAFAENLDRLKEMGVQTLWFMPIQPISVKDRKGSLGSYYAIEDYTRVNSEFGTMEDWNNLVKSAHNKGFKVIIDWVANHTGADHRWLIQHPDFYVKDSSGKPIAPFDWTDVRKLDYTNDKLRELMIASMKFWIDQSDIDGFRCDVAGEVPDDFWSRCIAELREAKDIFMLAEGDKPSLHTDGFNATYGWPLFSKAKEVAKGVSPASDLDTINKTYREKFPYNALFLNFTSNHDENSWNKADYETMPGSVHAPFAVLTFTTERSVPLIYSGQEEPVLRKLAFFDKDTINFDQYHRAGFYKSLTELRRNNQALGSDASFRKVKVGDEKFLYAFVREKGDRKVFVLLNFSDHPEIVNIRDSSLYGFPTNILKGTNEKIGGVSFMMQPWGYTLYDYPAPVKVGGKNEQ